jgi:hypothetical protein
MRESNLKHYRPKYKAPLYPWAQGFGIVAYIALIILLGWQKFLFAIVFLGVGFTWYFIYAYGRIKREYALLHVAERVMGEEQTDHLLDEELREILISRDSIRRSRLIEAVENLLVIDMNYLPPPNELSQKLAYSFSDRLGVDHGYLLEEFTKEGREAHLMPQESFVILSYQVKKRGVYDIGVIRTRRGAMFSEDTPPVHAAFIILFSRDESNFYLNSLMWLVKGCENIDFPEEWKRAKGERGIRELIINALQEQEKI